MTSVQHITGREPGGAICELLVKTCTVRERGAGAQADVSTMPIRPPFFLKSSWRKRLRLKNTAIPQTRSINARGPENISGPLAYSVPYSRLQISGCPKSRAKLSQIDRRVSKGIQTVYRIPRCTELIATPLGARGTSKTWMHKKSPYGYHP